MGNSHNAHPRFTFPGWDSGMHVRRLIHPEPGWLDSPSPRRVGAVATTALVGLAAYGFTVGFWRSAEMGGYVAVKLPLLVAMTLACNGLLNGLLGQLLGTGLGFRQSLLALLTSFALAAVILGSLAPITLFLAWNAPPPTAPGARNAHAAYLVTHTALIGFAGIAANIHLHRLLAVRAPRLPQPPPRCSLGSAEMDFSARSSRGFCGPFSARRGSLWSSSARTPSAALFTNPSGFR